MSAESAVSPGRDEHYLRAIRRVFRTWRGQRPFWAGLFTVLGGIPIAYFPYASFKLGHMTLSMSTTAGAGSLIIGVLLVTLGLTMWFHAIVRVFAGVATILLALISIPISNLGGFIVGFLLSLVGGALALSWAPGKPVAEAVPAKESAADPAALSWAPGKPVAEAAPAKEPAPEPADAPATKQWDMAGADMHESSNDANGGRNSAG